MHLLFPANEENRVSHCLPKLQVDQDLTDDLPFNHNTDDLHLSLAVWTDQRIHLPHFLMCQRSQHP